MKRYPHYWWQVRGKYCPTRIAVFDCDTAPNESGKGGQPCPGSVTRWALVTADMKGGERVGGMSRQGESSEYLWPLISSLCTSRESTWVFIPLAYEKLTALGFWDRLEDGRIELCGKDWKVDRGDGRTGEDRTDGLCVIEDPPTLILCRPAGKPGKLLILDTRNYGIEPDTVCAGCCNRVQGYIRGILSIVSTLRQGVPVSLRGTAASQAVQILRTHHEVVRLHCHTNSAALRLERAAYFGGRCECYRLGDIPGPVYHLDVRNMYPSVCLTLPIPVSIRSYTDDSGAAEQLVASGAASCAAHVRVRCHRPTYAYRRKGDTIFPVGEFDAYLCGPEIARAYASHSILRYYSAAWYTCAPYLAGFYRDGLDALRQARHDGRALLSQWIKRVMNSLVGKFGEPGRRWVPVPSRTERGPYGQWTEAGPDGADTRFRNVAWNTQRLEEHGESYQSIPAIAAWITSAARVRLAEILGAAGWGHVWYCDTDGILCDGVARERLLRLGFIRENEVGYLRTLGAYNRCHIHGIRHYELDGEIKCAGVAHGEIRAGETRAAYWDRHRAAREIALGLKPGTGYRCAGESGPEPYRHGVVGVDGMVSPIEINDG